MRVDRAFGELLADVDVIAIVLAEPDPLGDLVMHDLVAAVIGHDDDLARPVTLLDPHPAGHLRDRRLALGHSRLEDLLNPGQTLGNVLTRDTAGVERTHGQLGTGLTDGLRRDDADRLANVHELAGGQRPAIAGRTDAELRLARQHAPHPYRLDAGGDHVTDEDRASGRWPRRGR